MFGKRIALVRVIASIECRAVFSRRAWSTMNRRRSRFRLPIGHFWFFYWLDIYKPYKPINRIFSMTLSLPHANTIISMSLLYHFLLHILARFNNSISIPKIFWKVRGRYAHSVSKRRKIMTNKKKEKGKRKLKTKKCATFPWTYDDQPSVMC